MRKIIGVAWFTGMRTTIGIVVTRNEHTQEERAYIESGRGIDSVYDMEFIAYWGAEFPLQEAKQIILSKGEKKNHILKIQKP